MKTPSLKGEGTITLMGTEYKMACTFEALVNIEEKLGRDLLDVFMSISKLKLPLKVISVAFFEMQKAAGGKLTYAECGKLLVNAGFVTNSVPILNLIGEAIMAGRGEMDEGDGPSPQGVQ